MTRIWAKNSPLGFWLFKSPIHLFAMLLVLVSLFCGISFFFLRSSISQANYAAAWKNNMQVGALVSQLVQGHFDGLMAYVESHALRHRLIVAVQNKDMEAGTRLLSELVTSNKNVEVAFFSDPKGTSLFNFPTDPKVLGRNFAFRQWYQSVTAKNGTIVSEIYRTATGAKSLVVVVATPVRNLKGELLGYLTSLTRIDSLSRLAMQGQDKHGSNIFLLDQNGNLAWDDGGAGDIRNLSGDTAVSKFLRGETAMEEAPDLLTGATSLIGFSTVPGLNWKVLVSEPKKEVESRTATLARFFLAVFVIFGAGVLGWCFYWLNSIRIHDEEQRKLIETIKANSLENASLMEAELQTKQQFRAVVSNLSAILWSIDKSGKFAIAEGKGLEAVGVSAESLIGKNLFDLYKDREQGIASVRKVLEGEAQTTESIINGRFLRTHMTPQLDAVGRIVGAVGFSFDITDSRKAEDERVRLAEERTELMVREQSAVSASKLKSEFLVNMSHEIRTPINGIIGMARLLSETKLDRDQERFVAGVTTSSSILKSLINDILDLSKVEAGKLELELASVNIFVIVQEMKDSFEPLAATKGLSFTCDVENINNPYLSADATRLRQILNNLLSNAIKFTGQGAVSLVVRQRGLVGKCASLEFEVKDTGVGIHEDALPKMFQNFAQEDASTSRKYGGTGLGLAISKKIAELMGGDIHVESRKNVGSTFTLSVNLEVAGQEPKAAGTKAAIQYRLSRKERSWKKILVAEDNLINQEILVRILQKFGYAVDAVENGREALAAVEIGHYDLVLMDCQMPKMDGYEAAKRLRQAKYAGPIIAITANAFKEDRDRCLENGMTDYVAKPIEEENLIRIIDARLYTLNSTVRSEFVDAEIIQVDAVIDPIALDRVRKLDLANGDLLGRFISLYLETSAAAYSEIQSAHLVGDSQTIMRLVHTLKSSSGHLGAMRVVGACRRIESKCLKLHELAPEINCLGRSLAEVRTELQSVQNREEPQMKLSAPHSSPDTLPL